jgi:hypothetical protein
MASNTPVIGTPQDRNQGSVSSVLMPPARREEGAGVVMVCIIVFVTSTTQHPAQPRLYPQTPTPTLHVQPGCFLLLTSFFLCKNLRGYKLFGALDHQSFGAKHFPMVSWFRVVGLLALTRTSVTHSVSRPGGRSARSASALCDTTTNECASTCAEARDAYGVSDDGVYLLSLKVDATTIADYDASKPNQGCGVKAASPDAWPTPLNSGGYAANAEVQCLEAVLDSTNEVVRQDFQVYCYHMGRGPKDLGIVPVAFLEVDGAKNAARMQYADTLYTTRFRKLRFDERTQMIYTADCKLSVCL